MLGHSEADSQAWIQFGRSVAEAQHNRPVIVRDVNRNEHLKNISSINGARPLRWCVAAQIASKADLSIGYVIVVDTRDHDGLLDREADTLSAVAKQCMSHLERESEEQVWHRGARMTKDLGAFLLRYPVIDHMLGEGPTSRSNSSRRSERSAKSISQEEKRPKGESGPGESNTSRAHQSRTVASKMENHADEEKDETPYRQVFRRAAEFLRAALDVDGVLFADGLIGFHGTLQPAAEPEQELEYGMVQANKDKVSQVDSKQMDQDIHSRKFTSADYRKEVKTADPAEILGIAMHPDTMKPRLQQLSPNTLGLSIVDEGFLQDLMERYQQGRVWYFEDGPYYSDMGAISPDDSGDTQRLMQAFPGVRQLLFIPLKDPVDIKRLAGCFVWTTRVRPLLTDEDLPAMHAFAHIVEAEISRIDTIATVKQKESFMASVSHELRSPVHGILGAVEFLLDSDLDRFQESMADTIRACGTTLHETLSSVLAYTKINQLERLRDHPRQNTSPWSLENKHLANSENPEGMFVPVNVAELCEEVVEVILSARRSDLAINLNIAYHDWNFLTDPGALRRIMMNIVGNALKYTSQGEVEISLRVEHNEGNKDTGNLPENIIVFKVTDSGKGMSSAFLKNQLFVPFSQENPMSDGVGLGMSIVEGLVALLAGEMEVESRLGGGTAITVGIPMRVTEKKTSLERSATSLRKRAFKVALSPLTLEGTLRAYLEEWFGCKMVSWSDADVAFITEGELHSQWDGSPTVIVVHGRRIQSGLKENGRESISEPFGPGKLAKALLKYVNSGKKTDMIETSADGSLEANRRRKGLNMRKKSVSQQSATAKALTMPATAQDTDTGTAHELVSEIAPSRNEMQASGQHSRHSAAAILLVEDNHINLRLLRMYVKKNGAYQDIHTAENGLLAVQAVERQKEAFSVIVMDLSMPEMDGFEATRQIRVLEQERQHTPALIIALTGLASAGDRAKAYESGVDKFMTKPVRFQELDAFLVNGERQRER